MKDLRSVSELSERELIRLISQWVSVGQQTDGAYGIGDDCATIPNPTADMSRTTNACGQTILTTDLLVEGTHFLRNPATNWRHIGHKAASANISDLAAAGAVPLALLIAIGIPEDFSVEALKEFYQGFNESATPSGAKILGGDTTRSPVLTIAITAIGWKDNDWAQCHRSDALAGDYVYVTGPLGGSRGGLELLLRPELQTKVSKPAATELLRRHFISPPRIDVGLCLARNQMRTAVIDISDGLFNEANLMAKASGVQLEIELSAIPIDPNARELCSQIGASPEKFALFSGEEYELLFISPLPIQKITELFQANEAKCQLYQIGTVKQGNGVIILHNGKPISISDETFAHFA